MLYDGQFGKTSISDEFNQLCIDCRVEISIKLLPNPGNPMKMMRIVTFRNFNQKEIIKVTQFNEKKQIHFIPVKGELQIMLKPDEPLPHLEKELCQVIL
jgi:hypothetical protein